MLLGMYLLKLDDKGWVIFFVKFCEDFGGGIVVI